MRAGSLTRISTQSVYDAISKSNELGLALPPYSLPNVGTIDPNQLVAMHLIPHAAIDGTGSAIESLRTVMKLKVQAGTMEERSNALLKELEKIVDLPRHEAVEGKFLNEQVKKVASYPLGRAMAHVKGAEKKLEKQGKHQKRTRRYQNWRRWYATGSGYMKTGAMSGKPN
eukprot:2236022-Amphidinium_carterae.4